MTKTQHDKHNMTKKRQIITNQKFSKRIMVQKMIIKQLNIVKQTEKIKWRLATKMTKESFERTKISKL